jgi:hypothetical protein
MLEPAVIVIHATLLVAVHAQLEPVTTETLALIPVDAADALVGVTVYEQLPAPCVTETVWPATEIVPVRGTEDVFGATE